MKAVFLTVLSLIAAAPSWAQDADVQLLRSVSPAALPAAAQAIDGVPANPQPQDLTLFRKNVAAAQSELSERDVKKAVITSPRDGVYDVDRRLAALRNGQVIFSYSKHLDPSNDQRYARLLQEAKIYELKDGAGIKRFYQYDESAKSSREISPFSAAGQIATADFLKSLFIPPLTAAQQSALKQRLTEKDLLPLSLSSSHGVGLWRLKVFDGNSNEIREISIPALTPSCPSTSLDFCHFFQALQ